MNCEIISNQEVLINYSVDNKDINKSVILDIDSGKEFSILADYFKIFWIDHLNKFLIADKRCKMFIFKQHKVYYQIIKIIKLRT